LLIIIWELDIGESVEASITRPLKSILLSVFSFIWAEPEQKKMKIEDSMSTMRFITNFQFTALKSDPLNYVWEHGDFLSHHASI
jgi:hypothetical protein